MIGKAWSVSARHTDRQGAALFREGRAVLQDADAFRRV